MADAPPLLGRVVGEVPPARARRHPRLLAREVALWSLPAAVALLFGVVVGWWSAAAGAWGLVIGIACAVPLAVLRRRLIEELVDLVDSLPAGFDREPPRTDGLLVDRGLVEALWRLFRWLRERSAREAASQALQERLLRVLPDPLFQIDQRGQIVMANRAARERFGVALTGRPLRHVLRDPQILDAIAVALEGDLESRFEVQEPKALGRRFQVEVLPLRIPDEPPLALMVLRERTSEH
ncbi:MAG: PAS domain-containing protein, partial [Pseudomonadota bacterium]